VKDLRYIDFLREQGEQDFQEAARMWATKSHVFRYARPSAHQVIQYKYDNDEPIKDNQSDFLTRFLQ